MVLVRGPSGERRGSAAIDCPRYGSLVAGFRLERDGADGECGRAGGMRSRKLDRAGVLKDHVPARADKSICYRHLVKTGLSG